MRPEMLAPAERREDEGVDVLGELRGTEARFLITDGVVDEAETLSGNGTVTGNVFVQGLLDPGNSPGVVGMNPAQSKILPTRKSAIAKALPSAGSVPAPTSSSKTRDRGFVTGEEGEGRRRGSGFGAGWERERGKTRKIPLVPN